MYKRHFDAGGEELHNTVQNTYIYIQGGGQRILHDTLQIMHGKCTLHVHLL